MVPYCDSQIFLVPKIKEDTAEVDASFPFKVYRIKYFEFTWINYIKCKYANWLPVEPLTDMSFGFAALSKCLRIKKQYSVDVFHFYGIGLSPIATILKYLTKKPVVIMIDGSGESYSSLSGIYESILIKLTHLDHYFVVDNGGPALPKYTKLLGVSKLTPVFGNIDADKIHPKPKNFELSRRLGLDNYFVFISIHNLESVQGVEYSILGFKNFIVNFKIENAKLLVIGTGSQRDKLEMLTQDLDLKKKVLFIGAINNSLVPDYYSISDVALSTSLKINMNLATAEAMACKKPVICFDCGNTRDLLVRHMQNGILVPPGSIGGLAESMFLLYNQIELRIKLGENARNFIIQNRNWETRIETELEVYNKLIKQSQLKTF
jgi:glycosyltransferase involved in cell wall biosynthesis